MYAFIDLNRKKKNGTKRPRSYLSLILAPVKPDVEPTARLYFDFSACKLLIRVCTTWVRKPIQLWFLSGTECQPKTCTKL